MRPAPLIGEISKYFFIAWIMAGAIYFSWHMGRKYEKNHDPDITFAQCQPTANPNKLDCVLYEIEPDLAEIWKAIMAEINNPTTKEQLKRDYEAYLENKIVL